MNTTLKEDNIQDVLDNPGKYRGQCLIVDGCYVHDGRLRFTNKVAVMAASMAGSYKRYPYKLRLINSHMASKHIRMLIPS